MYLPSGSQGPTSCLETSLFTPTCEPARARALSRAPSSWFIRTRGDHGDAANPVVIRGCVCANTGWGRVRDRRNSHESVPWPFKPFGDSRPWWEGIATLMELDDPCGGHDCYWLDGRLELEGCRLFFYFGFCCLSFRGKGSSKAANRGTYFLFIRVSLFFIGRSL